MNNKMKKCNLCKTSRKNLYKKTDEKYYKVVNSNFGMPNNVIYKEGLNVTKKKLDIWNLDGIWYTNSKYVFKYLHYGPVLFEVSLSDKSTELCGIYEVDGDNIPEWRADEVILSEPMSLHDPKIIDRLISEGADIYVDNMQLFSWAVLYSPEVWKYLKDKYPKECNDILAYLYRIDI